MDNISEEDAGKTYTMDEYIGILEEQELEADLVLGGDEGKDCTYNKGYMKRQAIFSCLTCTPDGNAGVCCACSLSCHDGHQVVELWTKRRFRCDCGNSKFGEFFCKLLPNKDIENSDNSYNHNFKGSYCTCGRPYPDPEAEEPEEMIQCCVCEDWFHEEHMGLDISDEIPRDCDGEPLYEDFICGTCSAVCSVIRLYPKIILDPRRQDATIVAAKDKNVAGETSVFGSQCSPGTADSHSSATVISAVAAEPESDFGGTLVVGESSEKNKIDRYVKDDGMPANCMLEAGSLASLPASDGKPMFLVKNWRDVLCRCEKCGEFFSENHIGFLLDKEDSIMEYEKSAKLKREENLQKQEGAELNFLNKFGHVEKMEILHGINDMKDELRAFLESFDSSRAVTSADVQQIFENLEKKRRRVQ